MNDREDYPTASGSSGHDTCPECGLTFGDGVLCHFPAGCIRALRAEVARLTAENDDFRRRRTTWVDALAMHEKITALRRALEHYSTYQSEIGDIARAALKGDK